MSEIKISKQTLRFIKKNNICLDEILDAGGGSGQKVKDELSATGKKYSTNGLRCKKRGHDLRNRHGHCVICNPSSIERMARYHQHGSVYIAVPEGGKERGLIKIGMTTSAVSKRQVSLNIEKYAGFENWKIRYYVEVDDVGAIENAVHQALKDKKETRRYSKGIANELFRVELDRAVSVLNAVLSERKSNVKKRKVLPVVSTSDDIEKRTLTTDSRPISNVRKISSVSPNKFEEKTQSTPIFEKNIYPSKKKKLPLWLLLLIIYLILKALFLLGKGA